MCNGEFSLVFKKKNKKSISLILPLASLPSLNPDQKKKFKLIFTTIKKKFQLLCFFFLCMNVKIFCLFLSYFFTYFLSFLTQHRVNKTIKKVSQELLRIFVAVISVKSETFLFFFWNFFFCCFSLSLSLNLNLKKATHTHINIHTNKFKENFILLYRIFKCICDFGYI